MKQQINLYAKALLNSIDDEKTLDLVFDQICFLQQLANQENKFVGYFANLFVSKKERIEQIKQMFEQEINSLVLHWLFVLIDHQNFAHLEKICQSFKAQYYQMKNWKLVYLASAQPLSITQEKKIVQQLTAKYHQKIILQKSINPSLIAGLQLKIDSKIYDNSFQTKLTNLKNYLTNHRGDQ